MTKQTPPPVAEPSPAECSHPDWPQISRLRPKLQSHINIFPQEFRGEPWYILQDSANGRHLRLNQQAYDFVARIDGDHSIGEIYSQLINTRKQDIPTAEELILLVNQLMGIDALKGATVSAEEMFLRYQRQRGQQRKRAMLNPLAIKAPLFDPDTLLEKLIPYTRRLFSRPAIFTWFMIVGYAGLLGLVNFTALSASFNSTILEPDNLIAIALLFVAIKTLHEFAHALAVKAWGGEVHEMGITLLVLMPIPYVDASASASFREKEKRMLVAAAGIMAELFIAAIALFVWLSVEPGVVRSMAFNAILIASVSTLLFNANPLLRFDGYYILQDHAEIPNLYTRSGRYYLYLIQRYLFGLENAASPITAHGERRWFLVYGALAFFYRIFILLTIVFYLASEFLVIGVMLGCWAVVMQLLLPLGKAIHFLLKSPRLEAVRPRAKRISFGAVASLLAALCLIPLPLTSQSEGVLWVARQAEIYSATEGFVTQLLVKPGQAVSEGTPILVLENPSMHKEIAVARARRTQLNTESASERQDDWVKSQVLEHQANTVGAELDILEERYGNRVVRSASEGAFVPANPNTLLGRYLKQGELIGYIVNPESLIVKAVVSQSNIGLLEKDHREARIRFAERVHEPIAVSILRQVPGGQTSLPTAALGAAGGGSLAIASTDSSGRTAAETVFELELALPAGLEPLAGIGERAYVRFYHGHEPLAVQWWRKGRQLVLSQLDV